MTIYVLFYEEEKGKLTPWTFGYSVEEAKQQAKILKRLTKSDIYILRMRHNNVFPDYVDDVAIWYPLDDGVCMA